MMKAVETTSNLTFQKINDIISTGDVILQEIQKNASIRRADQLVQKIFTQPFTRVKIQGHHYYLNQELYRILSY